MSAAHVPTRGRVGTTGVLASEGTRGQQESSWKVVCLSFAVPPRNLPGWILPV